MVDTTLYYLILPYTTLYYLMGVMSGWPNVLDSCKTERESRRYGLMDGGGMVMRLPRGNPA